MLKCLIMNNTLCVYIVRVCGVRPGMRVVVVYFIESLGGWANEGCKILVQVVWCVCVSFKKIIKKGSLDGHGRH